MAVPLRATTLTVTSGNDSLAAASGTLRWAITNANANPAVDTILFNITGTAAHTINLVAPLPAITKTVKIDATTQSGYAGKPKIELNGAGAGDPATGLYLLASNCVIKGLAINRFPIEGIRIETYGGNVIQACFIGTGVLGTNALGNGNSPNGNGYGGISILSGNNTIGGLFATNRNLISGSNFHGIYILNNAVSNQILGNYIGVDVNGTSSLGNIQNGVTIASGRTNWIGGTDPGARNVISGNYESGIYLLGNTTISNFIQGNYLGTDTNGTTAIPNAFDGITISAAAGTLIGGTNSGARNVISGNTGFGVNVRDAGTHTLVQGNYVGTDSTGLIKVPNIRSGVTFYRSSGNTLGGTETGAGNVVSGNAQYGVEIDDLNATANTVQGNFIGVDSRGTNALGNTRHGVFVSGVFGNLIGGTAAGAGNVISANGFNGVYLTGTNINGNTVQGNLIGVDVSGRVRLANSLAGVLIDVAGQTVGGTAAGSRNVISGNLKNGVYLSGIAASNNVVQGNYLGTDVTGTNAMGNSYAGVAIAGGSGNTIGGSSAAARNVLSANHLSGINLSSGASNNVIQGNYIGSDATGTLPLGNTPDGISIYDLSSGNSIGGAGAGNLITANAVDGIYITNASAMVIQGNLIGVQADGTSPLGNTFHNVEIYTGDSNVIGGTLTAQFNTIAYAQSARNGVRIRNGTGHLIRGNNIFSNTAFGIDLGAAGVNANDACDTDAGANQLQNYPVLISAATFTNTATTVVSGSLNAAANTAYLLQFYANAPGTAVPTTNTLGQSNVCDQGQFYLGEGSITTSSDCASNYAFSVTLTTPALPGQLITATATDPANNTSEFSVPVVNTNSGPMNTAPVLPAQTDRTINELASLVVTNTATDSDVPANTLIYQLTAPPGAGIDANGIITWTPTEAQGPSTNTFTTVVTDNGIPPLSATNVFTVFVNEVNVAPVLPPQTDFSISELTLLTVTNTATDADIPANILAYQLSTPPSGAAIDTNGVITWKPLSDQAPSTNTLTTIVTDNGTPALSATNSFVVVVNRVTRPTLAVRLLTSSHQVLLSWPTNATGFVLTANQGVAPPGVWTTVTNTPAVSNGQFVVTLPAPAEEQYFRLLLQ